MSIPNKPYEDMTPDEQRLVDEDNEHYSQMEKRERQEVIEQDRIEEILAKQKVFEALLDEYIETLNQEFGVGSADKDEWAGLRKTWMKKWNACE